MSVSFISIFKSGVERGSTNSRARLRGYSSKTWEHDESGGFKSSKSAIGSLNSLQYNVSGSYPPLESLSGAGSSI